MVLNFNKYPDLLIPVVIQHATTNAVLTLAYMSLEAWNKTLETRWVTFFSRSRQSIWVKGETFGNRLAVVEILPDCDQDAVLIRAHPQGPACHRGNTWCFESDYSFLSELQAVIESRLPVSDSKSYISTLLEEGTDRAIQKVGEEAVETVIAAKNDSLLNLENESADLVFHLMVLLKMRKTSLAKVVQVLKSRHFKNQTQTSLSEKL